MFCGSFCGRRQTVPRILVTSFTAVVHHCHSPRNCYYWRHYYRARGDCFHSWNIYPGNNSVFYSLWRGNKSAAYRCMCFPLLGSPCQVQLLVRSLSIHIFRVRYFVIRVPCRMDIFKLGGENPLLCHVTVNPWLKSLLQACEVPTRAVRKVSGRFECLENRRHTQLSSL